MSWILAAVNAPAKVCETARGLVSQTPSSLCQTRNKDTFIAAGGIPETCHFHIKQQANAGWIVVGLGISLHESSCKTLSRDAWQAILEKETPNMAPSLPENGHFVALRWKDDTIEAFTDVLGVRTLYYAKHGKGLILSTRLNWIAALSGHKQIDYTVFGSHWLTFNQLTFDSPVQNIKRLGPNGHLHFSRQVLSSHQTPWSPAKISYSPDSFEETLQAFSNPVLPDNKGLSLGLSGGLDSRTLLALLDRQKIAGLHTFGPVEKADVNVACNIARGLGLPHIVLHEPVPSSLQCLELLRSHVAQTQAMTSASAVLGLRYYERLNAKNLAIIDGGFGEAARRQFLNRLLRRGATIFKKQQSDEDFFASFLPFIATPRADIFVPEIQARMEQGVVDQLKQVWSDLPPSRDFGLENTLDLFSTRTRLPNFFGYEQNRLDGLILNYMPFAQPSFLNVVFNTPIRRRKEGRLFRQIIQSRLALLADFPLVKGAYRYPYRLPSTGAYVWTKIKAKLKPAPVFPQQHQFLDTLKAFALDTVASTSLHAYAPYDIKKIRAHVASYYSGDESLAFYVDWWLSFEVWRQEISK